MLTFRMHLSDLLLQLVLTLLSNSNGMLAPIIIATTAHIQHFTHLLNGKFISVFLYESEYFPSPLEKMLTAFFRMSRSN